MKYFLDTVFAERPGSLVLISIGIVAEDGREFYAVSSDFAPDACTEWVKETVLPKLPPREKCISMAEIARRVRAFILDAPEFWAYYANHDWVLLCRLIGAMGDIPNGWPMCFRDLRQSMVERSVPRSRLPATNTATAHDALANARWVRDAWRIVYAAFPNVSGS